MINNSMEDVASKFGDDLGRLAAVMPILAKSVKFTNSILF